MPQDSQAITRLQQDRLEAIERLQLIQEQKAAAEDAVVRLTTTETQLQDEIADIDDSIAATLALP